MEQTVKILMTGFVTHDVKRFVVERPAGYDFKPGQATRLSINQPGWEAKARPFTFTSLADDLVLEFIIKGYFDHDGVTARLHGLTAGDEVILRDVWGTMAYKGPGVFIAGGTGITPFIPILRRLHADGKIAGHQLIFANRTARDVICRAELEHMLGDGLVLVLEEPAADCATGFVDRDLLGEQVKDFSQPFYLCGPPPMVKAVTAALKDLGARPEALVL